MPTSIVKTTFPASIEKVWNVITSNENYAWRSDISKIEITKPEKEFTEYTRDGFQTSFTITVFEPYKRYEFDMENENMHGHWKGLFAEENGQTTVEFTESITAKKFFMKPFVGMYLKKHQTLYINDLKKFLDN